jgi:5'/3'-nucleotidase
LARILLTNDDGFHSEGLRSLRDAVAEIGDVIVVAPDREMSAVSQSITLLSPLRYTSVCDNEYTVEGTPADCIILALRTILESPPQLIISGINKGPNLGDDISYSGTVAGALEGTFNGIPSMAVSLAGRSDLNFKPGAEFAARLAGRILEKGLPEDVLLNVNVPLNWTGTVEFTRQGKKRNKNVLQEGKDPRGGKYFWVEDPPAINHGDAGSDFAAIEAGSISITPLHLDRTDFPALKSLSTWQQELTEEIKSDKRRWFKRLSSLKI